jgi:hypothetical protein
MAATRAASTKRLGQGWMEFVTTGERTIVLLEEQLYTITDTAERHRLLQLLIRELAKGGNDVEFAPVFERRIAENKERYKRQKELVARLKRDGSDVKDGYFQLVTLKTIGALFCYYHAMARKIVICVVRR